MCQHRIQVRKGYPQHLQNVSICLAHDTSVAYNISMYIYPPPAIADRTLAHYTELIQLDLHMLMHPEV